MTKKSASRIRRDIAAGKRAAPGNTINMAPVSRSPLQATANGGYSMSAADRILQECARGLDLVPQKPKNTCWNDLMGVYHQCAGMMYQHTEVTTVLRDRDLITYVDDIPTFNSNVQQFASDLAQMNKELMDLRALHADKTGGSDDTQEVLHAIAINEQYQLWMSKHEGVVVPTITHILDQTNRAEHKRRAAIMEQQQQQGLLSADVPTENLDNGVVDVNTITDVNFKEESVGQIVPKLRGETSSILHVDEAGFLPVSTAELNAMPAQA
jgi:hypothetical protein